MAWALALTPLMTALVTACLPRHRPARTAAVACGGLITTLALALWAAAARPTASLRWSDVLALTLEVDGLGRVMAVLVPAVALPVTLYATSYLAGDAGLGRLVALLVAFVAAMELLVAASDLLSLLVGWELVAACSWALIGHHWADRQPPTAARQAFVVTRLGDVGLYVAAAAALAGSGSLAFDRLPGGGWELHVVAGGLLVAAAAKSAQLPFSPWLFAAMAGPTPVSALLHSATMVAAGAYILARLGPALSVAGWFGPAVMGLGLATALAGGVVAAAQTDFKRALAASTSAQYGLVLVAAGAGSTAAAASHLVTHAAFKALLFLVAGVAIHAVGSGRLGEMRLGSSHRRLAGLSVVGALALAAVPPLGGAASKEAVLATAAHRSPWWGVGVLAAGLLSAFYASRLQLLAFGRGRQGGGERTSRPQVAAMSVLAAASVALGALWLPSVRNGLEALVGGRSVSAQIWELAASLATVSVAVALAWALDRRGRLVGMGLAPALQHAMAGWLGLPVLGRRLVVDPVLALARLLAELDDRVVDAGVRAAGALADTFSRVLAWWGERGVDGLVVGAGGAALAAARASRRADERAVDVAVERVASVVALAGRRSRGLQTGLAHHYYVLLAAGVVVVLTVAALGAG